MKGIIKYYVRCLWSKIAYSLTSLRNSGVDFFYPDALIRGHMGVKLAFSFQTVSDIERGWILANKDQHRQLKSLQEKGSKKEVSTDASDPRSSSISVTEMEFFSKMVAVIYFNLCCLL